ncbi:MAG TPA: diacylglycerol kinase family protein [Bacteroidales bacterium]|jgi:diacylglycerol kinase|nr:diacylglycerol kinase family protein [Bacteroidales bacterium]OQB63017.1 MAG: Undecaprenol kinase [Bacteroidetes bacterium ADurb.Bin145]NMD01825.1 diacylglycerol kinase family protein [Bacteroidales bacterium]HOU01527.1 diacylglycerol kinase family protein [Bacteroidales bacterium]HQG62518.1 diacylglycerol kinase family protein [Bacteroidales bacterium]
MESGNRLGLHSRYQSIRFAVNGIKTLFREEKNAVIQLLIFAMVIIAGFFSRLSDTEWILITTVSMFVFACECFNTALEDLSDFVTGEKNEKIRKIKDLAAGGVLISALGAAITGMIIFFPRFLDLFN